jgi:putative spermidine/putrescine transport system ATP-binding protein
MSTTAALALQGLNKHYGAHAVVRDVTLEANPGELIVLLGPSGCGKTTTLRLIAGFVAPTSGDIRLDGRSITALPPHRREMGIVFQSYALFPHLTVARNVAFGLEMRRTPTAAIDSRVGEMLRLVKLDALAARLPRELSGGQQQRVALARALAIHPRLLLLDEPLSNLDAALRAEVAREIRILQRNGGITTIMVTHDQSEAMAMADRLVVMHDGSVQQVGTPEDIHAKPANPFVAQFIGGSNMLKGRLEDGSRLVMPDGASLTLAARYPVGHDTTVALRPDSVHLLTDSGDAKGDVELCTWLGSVVEHVVRLGPDTTVVSRGPALGRDAVRRYPPGTRVALSWAPSEERVFDPAGRAVSPTLTIKESHNA